MSDIDTESPEIDFILKAAADHATGIDGALLSFYDARDGRVVDGSAMVEDFGDIAPFLWVAGAPELARREFAAVNRVLGDDLLHVNPRRSRPWMVHTYDWTDLLLGLVDYYQISGDPAAMKMAGRLFTVWEDYFYHDGMVYGQAIKAGTRLYVLPVAGLLDTGMFPELLLKYAACLDNERSVILRQKAQTIVSCWQNTAFFQETGLFADVVAGGGLRGLAGRLLVYMARQGAAYERTTLFKHNTNALASVLEVWRQTGDPALRGVMEQWSESCRGRLMTADGMISMQWHKRKGIISGPTDHNFQVVDLMCDLAYYTGDHSYIGLAETVAVAWLAARGKTGLLPHQFSGAKSGQAMMDSQTDFAVALLKLGTLTRNEAYITAAEDIMSAVKKYMHLPCGIITWADVDSGVPVNTVCKTKFMILSLKAWLALCNKSKIYQDEQFTELLCDR